MDAKADRIKNKFWFKKPPNVFGGHHIEFMYRVVTVMHLIIPEIENEKGNVYCNEFSGRKIDLSESIKM